RSVAAGRLVAIEIEAGGLAGRNLGGEGGSGFEGGGATGLHVELKSHVQSIGGGIGKGRGVKACIAVAFAGFQQPAGGVVQAQGVGREVVVVPAHVHLSADHVTGTLQRGGNAVRDQSG